MSRLKKNFFTKKLGLNKTKRSFNINWRKLFFYNFFAQNFQLSIKCHSKTFQDRKWIFFQHCWYKKSKITSAINNNWRQLQGSNLFELNNSLLGRQQDGL